MKKNSSTSFKVEWYENEECDGYELKYWKSGSDDIHRVYIDDYSTTSKTIDDLSSGKYRVQLRCYVEDGDKTYNSKWTDLTDDSKVTLKAAAKSSSSSSNRSSSSSGSGGCYWTPNGEKWHSTPNCPTLSRSKVINSGNPGYRDACKVCN